ncbi:MAG: hypothetical protein OEV91_02450 [Desulfobulbaceae bacterium]|nr:hypothetical protein [Desulfobulbaceae bacterium]
MAEKGGDMNIANVLLKVGGAVVSSVVPGGAAIVEMVNAFLPDDKKLPATATGTQVQTAVDSLPPEQKEAVLLKEMDVQIEDIKGWTNIVESLATADGVGASTRPKIAMMMAWAVCATSGLFTLAWAWAIVSGDATTLMQLGNSYLLITALLATPTALLYAYFGMRKDEKLARYGAAMGQAPAPPSGLTGLIKSFTGK